MAKKVFIGATGQNCGKTTMSVSLMHLARKKYPRVGFIKPIGPKLDHINHLMVDMDALLMAKTFGLEEDLARMSPVALHRDFTKDFLKGKLNTPDLEKCIKDAVTELESKYDFLIIEGAGHTGVGSVIGLNNARVARMLDAPVIVVCESGIGRVIDAVHLNLALFHQEQADVRAIMINKLLADKRDSILGYLNTSFKQLQVPVIGGFNYSPVLANPTLGHVGRLLKLGINGNPAGKSRIIHNIQLGAASSQRVIDNLLEDTLLIVTSSRDELIVTMSSLCEMPTYKTKIVGLVIAGYAPVSEISQQILDESGIPYIRVEQTTANVYSTLMDDVAKITYEDQEKLNWIKANAEHDIDFEALDSML